MIRFENIKKSFGDRTILKGISFEIKEGEIVFILGMSGTGKSVSLKNIVGLLKPDSGKIYIDGEEISSYTEEQMFPIRKKCGMVFQHPALFDSMTVFENIAFGLRRLEQLPEEQFQGGLTEGAPAFQGQFPNRAGADRMAVFVGGGNDVCGGKLLQHPGHDEARVRRQHGPELFGGAGFEAVVHLPMHHLPDLFQPVVELRSETDQAGDL